MQTNVSPKLHPTPAGLIARLRQFAFAGLARMYCAPERQFYFRLRRTPHGVVPEGRSPRYAAISLFGLAREDRQAVRQVLHGQSADEVCAAMVERAGSASNLGDVALSLWAAHAWGHEQRALLWKRVREIDPLGRTQPTVELSWTLDAALLEHDYALADRLAQRLLTAYRPEAGVFAHIVGGHGARAHIACFADMVYPIHALSNYARLRGNEQALATAVDGARMICTRQGASGQWWWHYDQRTGAVVEGYPVYAIHQDAMAPMALFALRDAKGPDFSSAIQRGLDWLTHAPEIDGSLIDDDARLIWRKVARREPGKLTRYAQAAVSRVHPAWRVPGVDTLFPPLAIDYEDRPYHLGWLLYAWPESRAVAWDRKAVSP